jgi:hypothetical protein
MTPVFRIETDRVRLVWSGKRRQVAGPPVSTGLDGPVQLLQPAPTFAHLDVTQAGPLQEQTDYLLFVQTLAPATVMLHHRDPVLLRGLHGADDGRTLHGVVNFGAQVGQSRFVVAVDGKPHLAFIVSVSPSKLDYVQDYRAMRAEVEAFARGLALEYLRTTVQPGEGVPAWPVGTPGWVLLLHTLLADLEQALGYVAAHPYRAMTTAPQMTRIGQVRPPSAAVRRAVLTGRGQGGWTRLRDGTPVHTHLPAPRPQYALDTPEHRWIAARLQHLGNLLGTLRGAEARRPGVRQGAIDRELASMQQRVGALGQLPPFQESTAATEATPLEPSLRLLTAPGYREAYQALLRLQQGLHLEGEALALTLKDLHLLYEYWCFLTLVQRVADATDSSRPPLSLLSVAQDGLRLRLRQGRDQTVGWDLPGGGQVSLTYNPRFGGKAYLVPQQPDFLLTVAPPDGPPRHYVLDAKYRIDTTPGYVRRFGMPGPPVEALNDLHRYRDAIRIRGERTVVQALVLFPWREDVAGTFAASRHYRLLNTVGIGALPLLPGATDPLAAWLRQVVGG